MAKYTGVTFDGVHSYETFGLRLKTVELGFPETKTYYVDVPGMNGMLDLTEAMQGGVRFGNRTLIFTFDARQNPYDSWTVLLAKIAEVVHGQKIEIAMDFDSGYYYVGRCALSTEKTNEVLSQIVIECDCEPYKYYVGTSDEAWIWDTFSFVDGIAQSTADITINSTSGWQAVEVEGKEWNDTLKVISDSDMLMKYKDVEYEITAGSNLTYTLELDEGVQTLYFQGKGTITIVRRGGRI